MDAGMSALGRRGLLAGLLGLGASPLLAGRPVVRWVAVNGAELAVVEAGAGEPVLLVHGGLQDYRFWAGPMARLARRYRVIAYSRRNHFPNAVAADGLPDRAAESHAEDMAELLRQLGLARAHVVAHSAGAHAALFLASRHPAMVSALVVNEPPAAGLLLGDADGEALAKTFAAGLEPARAAFRAGEHDAGIRLFADAVGGPGGYARKSATERAMMRDNVLAHVADAVSPLPPARFTCAMAGVIAAPVLLTSGANSPVFFHRIVDAAARCIPAATRVDIPGAWHTVPAEAEAAFGEAVLAFLSSATVEGGKR